MPPEGQGLPPPPTATPTTTTTEQLYPSLPSSVKDGAELKKKDAMSTASVIPSNVHMMPTATQDDNAVVNVGRGLVRRESSAKLSPWRELDSNAFVIAYSVKGTARCGACQSKVAKGELQVSQTHDTRSEIDPHDTWRGHNLESVRRYKRSSPE